MFKQELIRHLIDENGIKPDIVNKMTPNKLVKTYIERNDGIKTYEEFIIVAGAFNVELDKIELE